MLLGTAMLVLFFGILFLDYIFDSDIGLGVLSVIMGLVGLWEFYGLVEKKDFTPFKLSGIVCGVIVFLGLWLSVYREGFGQVFYGIFVFIVLWLFGNQFCKQGINDAIKNVSVTIFGIIYTFYFLSFVMLLRHMQKGFGIILLVLLITKGGDIGGYFFGSWLGKHKLTPISPKKTIEGALFCLLSSVAIAVGLNSIPGMRILPIYLIVPFGLLLSAVGIFGDLIESAMKRDMEVKDSSSVIPAFGGILDIIDSLLISIPVAYYFLVMIGY
ncbi:MAG: phosphatidate cytidylyltransferase [Candidatus Scalinduaceae bacterium]